MEQLQFKIESKTLDRVLIPEAFYYLWEFHLKNKPCQRPLKSNRHAICQSWKEKYMDIITEVDVEQHKETRLRGLNGFRKVSIGTVFHDHTLITLLYNKFYEWRRRAMVIDGIDFKNVKLPNENPTKYVRKLKAPPRTVLLSQNEFSRLIEHATDRLSDIIYFALHNAIRPGDLSSLKVRNWNHNKKRLEFIQSKTGKYQSLPITKKQHEIIRKRMRQGKEFILDFTNYREEWERAKRMAKLPHLQFRDLRRTTINEITKYSGNPMHGQRIAGHAHFRTTVEHYIVMETIDLKNDINHLAKVFY